MNVQELIEKLQKLDPTKELIVWDLDNDCICNIEHVALTRDLEEEFPGLCRALPGKAVITIVG